GQGDRAEGDDQRGVNQCQGSTQVVAAVGDLEAGRRAVEPRVRARVAEDRVGDEDVVAGEPGLGEQSREVATRLVGGQRYAGAVAAQAAGRLCDEQDARVERAVGVAEDSAATLHR